VDRLCSNFVDETKKRGGVMSTSILYHGFGIRGYKYQRTRHEDGKMTFVMKRDEGKLKCPDCGSGDVIRRGKKDTHFQDCPDR
jgi:ssDNA-binding Zn-finger/Zn-ribbon topoisomerase 1